MECHISTPFKGSGQKFRYRKESGKDWLTWTIRGLMRWFWVGLLQGVYFFVFFWVSSSFFPLVFPAPLALARGCQSGSFSSGELVRSPGFCFSCWPGWLQSQFRVRFFLALLLAFGSVFSWRRLSPLAWPASLCKGSPPSEFSASFFCLFLAEWAAAAGLPPPVSSPSCAPQRGPLPAARGSRLSPPSAACHLHVMVHGVLLLSGRHADVPSPPPLLLLLLPALWDRACVGVWARP